MKQFTQLTPSDQQQHLQKMQQFLDSFPTPCPTDTFREGMSLISIFPQTTSFINERNRFRDYNRQAPSLKRWLTSLIASAQKQLQRSSADSRRLSVNDAHAVLSTPRRVGRPTKQQQEVRKEAEAVAKQEQDRINPSLFGEFASPASLRPHLDQLSWLMSDSLRTAVENLRDTRRQFEDAQHAAKLLAEHNATEEEIAQHAQEAIRLNAIIEDIYVAVDREMAECSVRLKYDPRYIAQITALLEPRYGKTDTPRKVDELRLDLKQYLDVVLKTSPAFKQEIIDKIHSEDPALKAQREAEQQRHDRIAAIRKYLLRTDKLNTPARVKTMQQRIDELKQLNDPNWQSYLPVLEKAQQESQQYKKK